MISGTIIGQSLKGDLSGIGECERYLNEGDIGEVRIYLKNEASQEQLQQIEKDILLQGVTLNGHVTEIVNCVIVPFIKKSSPLAAIASVGTDLTNNDIIGWQIIKTSLSTVPTWVWWAGGLGIFAITMTALRKR